MQGGHSPPSPRKAWRQCPRLVAVHPKAEALQAEHPVAQNWMGVRPHAIHGEGNATATGGCGWYGRYKA